MPYYVIHKEQDALNDEGKAAKGSKILILGLAYKPDVDDVRETLTAYLIEGLRDLGGEVDYHDPHCPEVPPMREHAEIAGMKSVSLNRVADFDLVLIAKNHSAVDYDEWDQKAQLIVDTHGAMGGVFGAKARVNMA